MRLNEYTKKALVLITAASMCIGSFTACGSDKGSSDKKDNKSSESSDSNKSAEDDKSYKPAKEIVEAMASSVNTLPELKYVEYADESAQDTFESLCDIDYSLVKDFCIAYSIDTESPAEEILVIRLSSEEEAKENVSMLDERIDRRKKMFMNYKPEFIPIINKSKTDYDGSYLYLIISADSEVISRAFDNSVE